MSRVPGAGTALAGVAALSAWCSLSGPTTPAGHAKPYSGTAVRAIVELAFAHCAGMTSAPEPFVLGPRGCVRTERW